MAIVMVVTYTKAKHMEQSEHELSNSEHLYIFFCTIGTSLVLGLVSLEREMSLFPSHADPILYCPNPPNRQSSPPFRGASVRLKAHLSRLIRHIPHTL